MPPQETLAPLEAGLLQAGIGGATTRRRAAIALIIEGHDLQAQDNAYLAEKRFERAVSVDPSCGEAYLALAELRFGQQQWEQAADLSTKAALRLGRDNYFLARAHLVAAKALVNGEQPPRRWRRSNRRWPPSPATARRSDCNGNCKLTWGKTARASGRLFHSLQVHRQLDGIALLGEVDRDHPHQAHAGTFQSSRNMEIQAFVCGEGQRQRGIQLDAQQRIRLHSMRSMVNGSSVLLIARAFVL
jgi:tetratricopeptide (TPR) repeat protein